ncbi:hypothetical protein [Spiroplasma sp. DGKH1]|uniref:hypothetical protein n=1 Tax=Spiroplasma sp. DGKH1 TaxID=3050074 RepID=UPI0034C63923
MTKIDAITELFLHEVAQDWNKSNKDNLLQHADNYLETTIKNYLEHTSINSYLLKEMAQQGYMPLENIEISKTSDKEIINLVTADLKELIYNNLKQQHFNDSQELTR